jgi:hypothetical protein
MGCELSRVERRDNGVGSLPIDDSASLREHLAGLRRKLDEVLSAHEVWEQALGEPTLVSPGEEQVLRQIKLRSFRSKCFRHDDLFFDPGWDILLDLYAAHLGGRRLSVTDACIGSQAPPTTGLRWVSVLESRGLISRARDCRDGRRVYVSLTEEAVESMERYFKHCIES